jgi:glyoxylase-like metal-dependent hydrolase (beta-lactamase superfamily II)
MTQAKSTPQPALVPLGERLFYLPGAVNVGVIALAAGGCLLIDSGADRDHAKRLLKACRNAGLEPRAIINTHAHADHHGGNEYLQEVLEIPCYAPIFEESVLRYPIWEPMYLYGGVRPPKVLQNKWLLAAPSSPKILAQAGPVRILDQDMVLLDTSGHASIMFSVLVEDVLFASDAVFGRDVLAKYPLPFAVDIAEQRRAMHAVGNVAGVRLVLPGHGPVCTDVAELVEINLAAIARASQVVLTACALPGTLPDIVARVCAMLEIIMTDWTRYHLNQTTVLAYLTELLEDGLVTGEVIENRLLWRAV